MIWNELEVNEWSEYVDYLNSPEHKKENFIYRGQANVNDPIVSSFHRLFKSSVQINRGAKKGSRTLSQKYNIQRENKLITEFKSKYHLYSNTTPELLSESELRNLSNEDIYYYYKGADDYKVAIRKLEWLSIMQHYSAPTRLIDWTFSPYIAAYFALEFFSETSGVFCLDTKVIDEYHSNLEKKGLYKLDFELGSEVDPNWHPVLLIYDPLIKNQRQSMQQGLFTVPSPISGSTENFFEAISKSVNKPIGTLIKFNTKAVKTSVTELKFMGITSETIYPGIEGMAKSLRFSFLHEINKIKHNE